MSEADRIWLADYERRTGGRGREPARVIDAASSTTPTTALARYEPPADLPRNTPAIAGGGGGDQLALEGTGGGEVTAGRFVHESPRDVRVDEPEARTWIPEVPPAEEAQSPEATAPGVPPPPTAGAPIVDEPAKPADPAAAAKFGALVGWFASVGIGAGLELLDAGALPVPPMLHALLKNPALHADAVKSFAEAGERMAAKYGLGGVGVPDEALVALALVGSGALVVKNERRKQLAAGRARPRPQAQPQAQPPADNLETGIPTVGEPAQPAGDDELSMLLGKERR